jgi:hypothetical protein
MKKLLFLGACLVALASQPVLAQASGTEVVIVQINTSSLSGYITITRGLEKAERVDFEWHSKKYPEETVAYQQVVSKLYQEGYSIKSTFTSSASRAETVTVNMVFVKGQ